MRGGLETSHAEARHAEATYNYTAVELKLSGAVQCHPNVIGQQF